MAKQRKVGFVERLLTKLDLLAGKSNSAPLVCGPFLGEVGYETLYWIPFFARMLEAPALRDRPVTFISRGGAEPLYRLLPSWAKASYIDAIDLLGPSEFLNFERQRLGNDPLKKNQKEEAPFEVAFVERAGLRDCILLRPAHMFRLLRRGPISKLRAFPWHFSNLHRDPLTVVKFWFGPQFPASDRNLRFVRRLLSELDGPTVAIDNHFTLEIDPAVDDPFRALCRETGIRTMSPTSFRTNLSEQFDLISRATRLVGTYGGFCYVGLYAGTEMVSHYSAEIVFTRHLTAFCDALECLKNNSPTGDAPGFSLIKI